MKNLLTTILVLAALVVGGRWAWEKFGTELAEDDAKRRVKVALEGMRDGGDEQSAATQFFDGSQSVTDDARLARAWDRWMEWRREGGYGTAIAGFRIGGVDSSGEVPVVSVTIEGSERLIAVPPGEPLRWAD